MERREGMYRIGDLATLSGVSVRTLHHYDRIGLLSPAERTESGARRYAEGDLLRLQQVLTLRALGFALRDIRELLDRADFDLLAALRIQREALRERAAAVSAIERAISELIEHRETSGTWDWELVAHAANAAQRGLERRKDATMNFTPEQMQRFEQLGREIGDDRRKDLERRWTELIAEVDQATHLDPASEPAQALGRRWDALMGELEESYRGYEDLWQAIGENYQAGAFESTVGAPHAETYAFMERVKRAGSAE